MVSTQSTNTPEIYIKIKQPGDWGNFQIRVIDQESQKVICENQLPQNINYLQYLYTAQLLEHKSRETAARQDEIEIQDDSWMKSDRYQDMVRYGQKLYSDLFGAGRESKKFQRYLKREKAFQGGVRIILEFHHTASELFNIPWEYIHDGTHFLAIEGNHSITRRSANATKQLAGKRSIPRPLRILFVISDPHGGAPLNTDHEINMTLDALKQAVQQGLVAIDYIEEGSLDNIAYALAEHEYHVLHYTGHGAMLPGGSCLILEDEDGNPKPAFINDLLPVLAKHPSLRLVFLSGCQTGQIDQTQATSGVATGLLETIPAVVAMQFSILDRSAQVFTAAFYAAIGNGQTLEEALQAGRTAMHQHNPELADWGIPALYQQGANIRLVDPSQQAKVRAKRQQLEATNLPVPPILVGRRQEMRELRAALTNWRVSTAFVWGMGGVGKSALVGRLIERPGIRNTIEAALVIRCDQTRPEHILPQITQWLATIHPQAAVELKNTQVPIHHRVAQMAEHVKQKRLVIIFDHFNTYMREHPEQRRWGIPQKEIRIFFRALASVKWPGLIIFTSRYRWMYLNDLALDQHLELHLHSLHQRGTFMLCGQLPALKKADHEIFKLLNDRVGGHPQTLLTIDQLYAQYGNKLVEQQASLTKQLGQFWHKAFLGDLIARLTPTEKSTLIGLSVLESAFWVGQVQIMAQVPDREQAEIIMARWEALSLAHFVHLDNDDDPWYQIHQLVRSYLLDTLKPDQRKELHARAAAMMEKNFASTARLRYQTYGGPQPPDDDYLAARSELRFIFDNANMVGIGNMLGQALDWRKHYLAYENYERANDLVNDIWHHIAFRYDNMDLARQLLQESIETTSGRDKLIAETNLAVFLQDNDREEDAMKIYDRAIKEFKKLDDMANVAPMLSMQASYYERKNNYKKAFAKREEVLKIHQDLHNRRGEVMTLAKLADLCGLMGKLELGLKYSLLAERLAEQEQFLDEYCRAVFTRADILRRQHKDDEAFEAYNIALQISQQRGNHYIMVSSLSQIGLLLHKHRRSEEAVQAMLQAISLSEQAQRYGDLAIDQWRLAIIYFQSGVVGEAVVMAERALKNAEEHRPDLVGKIREHLREYRRHNR